MNLPTALTLLRILMVPFLVVVLLAPPWHLADSPFFGEGSPAPRELLGISIFLLAMLTDVLDGHLARRRNQITTLGILLDPIADKLLMSAAFISLVELRLAPAWMVVIIVGREFVVSGLRTIVAMRGVALAASPLGKLKTATQVVAISLLILTNTLERWGRFGWLGVAALWLCLLIALASMVDYLVRFISVAPGLAEPARRAPAGDEGRGTAEFAPRK
ncbi:MAG: CDP-diacylglycerol--glycerol-3-phosphate 3-phosphatidyltransferase [Acidobacteria bacterium]|nr:CDP-diacylglycerol--glycerol-3-phosphate 3-phosphatidyltransferase [Acidobacteriota bacterium]